VPMPIELPPFRLGTYAFRAAMLGLLTVILTGCGWEPSERELKNAQAFEALLTAISLKNHAEFLGDAKLIEGRHAAGDISDDKYQQLKGIIEKGREKDWAGAEKQAYDFRSQFGDQGSFFK
jgi:hypothetical protein